MRLDEVLDAFYFICLKRGVEALSLEFIQLSVVEYTVFVGVTELEYPLQSIAAPRFQNLENI
jgi:hypothetical protein